MIPYGKQYIDEDDIKAVTDVLRGNWLTQGPVVAEFENAVANYVGAKYAVAVSSGTAALHMAAQVAGIVPGTALVTSPITFVATSNAALYLGGEALFADVESETINLSPQSLRSVVDKSSNIKVIVPVHFAGLPCAMEKIKSIADDIDAVVIEDAAHALGSQYSDGSMVGSCANSLMTIFSFHPVKAIAAGEGGMITTNDESVYHQLLRLRSHGINKGTDQLVYPDQQDQDGLQAQWYYEMQELGYNYRITDIQCALGLSQLSKLNLFIKRRRELVENYDKAFANIPHCMPAQKTGRGISGHHIYVLRIDFQEVGISRQRFMYELREKGINTQVHYIPVPMQPLYKKLGHEVECFANAMHYYDQAITIPLYYSLQEDQQEYVIQTISALLN
jgi:perosamine synthetase